MGSRVEAVLAGISGSLGFALTLVGALMTGDLEAVGTDPGAVVRFYQATDFDAGYRTGVILETLGFLLILAFMVKLAAVVDDSKAGSRWLGSVALASAVVATALTLVSVIAFSAGVLGASHGGADGGSVMLEDLRNGAYWLSLSAWSLVYLATGAAIVRLRALPVWLGWASVALGVVHVVLPLLPPSAWDVPVGIGGLWLLATAIVMIAKSRSLRA